MWPNIFQLLARISFIVLSAADRPVERHLALLMHVASHGCTHPEGNPKLDSHLHKQHDRVTGPDGIIGSKKLKG